MKHAVYMILTADGYLYTGITYSLKKRFKQHCLGIKSILKYRKHPFKLVFFEIYQTKELAALREKQIKGITREKKEKLIKNFGKVYSER